MRTMELVVATVGRPHGLRGDVFVDLRTDIPEERFAIGQVLGTSPDQGTLTVSNARIQNGRWVLGFEEIPDRTAAETLTGLELTIDADDSDEEEAWYSHELVGMRAELPDGTPVGKISAIDQGAAHDFLILSEPNGAKTLIPFVKEIVPEVNNAGGVVVLTPPGGLLASDTANLVISPETSSNSATDKGKAKMATDKDLSKATADVDEYGGLDDGDNDRWVEEAAKLAAPLAPRPGTKLPGEIAGTIEGEDVDTHQHLDVPLEPETSES